MFDEKYFEDGNETTLIKSIRNDVYPLTAYISSLENFLDGWDSRLSFNWKIFSLSSVLIFLALFFKLDISSYEFIIAILSWTFGLELLLIGIIRFFITLKFRNKFISEFNKVELENLSMDDFMEKKISEYRRILKEKNLL